MNEELKRQISERITEYLALLEQGVKVGVGFTSEQTPILLQELLSWTIMNHGTNAILLVVVVGVLVSITQRCRRNIKKFPHKEDSLFFVLLLSTALALLLSFCAVNEVRQAIKPIFAPRVFLLEQLKELSGRM